MRLSSIVLFSSDAHCEKKISMTTTSSEQHQNSSAFESLQLIPCMENLFQCPFFWGNINREEAKSILAEKPDKSFLLRQSEKASCVLELSFMQDKCFRSCGIDKSDADCEPKILIELLKKHFQLEHSVPRKSPFSLKELARAIAVDLLMFEDVSVLQVPQSLKNYLREYHYKSIAYICDPIVLEEI